MTFTVFNLYYNNKDIVITGKDDIGHFFVLGISEIDKQTYNDLSYDNDESHIKIRYKDQYYNIDIFKCEENFLDSLDGFLQIHFDVIHSINGFEKKDLYVSDSEFDYSIYKISSLIWTITTGMVLARL